MLQLMISLMLLKETGKISLLKTHLFLSKVTVAIYSSNAAFYEFMKCLIFYFFRVYIPCIYLLNKIDQISIEVSISSDFYESVCLSYI